MYLRSDILRKEYLITRDFTSCNEIISVHRKQYIAKHLRLFLKACPQKFFSFYTIRSIKKVADPWRKLFHCQPFLGKALEQCS